MSSVVRGQARVVANVSGRAAPDPGRVHSLADLTGALDRLRRRAAGKGQVRLSVREIAKLAGRAPSTLDPYLRGQRLCPQDTYEEILRAFGVPAQQLGPWLDAWERVADSHQSPRSAARTTVAPPIGGLPRPTSLFTNREPELAAVLAAVTGDHDRRICVIHGLAGVGKTALAVRAATMLADHFRDGTVFLNLQGYIEGRPLVTAAQALDRMLRRLGVDPARIPPEQEERAAFLHSLLADRRLLLVLDDARELAQVEPLLPRAAGCAAIITSRRRLAGLDEAVPLPVDPLPPAHGVALFNAVVGPDRLRADPAADAAIARIVTRCGQLPLAIRIAAARYRASRVQTLVDLDTDLSGAAAGIPALDDGDRSVAGPLRATVSDLPEAVRRSFGLLTVPGGGDIAAEAATALLGHSRVDAMRHLDQLADRHLIIEHTLRRYAFHDLVAAFARAYARETLLPTELTASLRRVVDFYLRTAHLADCLVSPHRFRVSLDLLDKTPELPRLDSYDAGLAWLTLEESNLADACLAAATAGCDALCWQLAYTLRGYYFLTKRWQPWVATHQAALAATRRCGDARAEAMIANGLGLARLEQGDQDAAADCYQDAQRLFQTVGDQHGEHTARANLAWIQFARGQYTEFLRQTEPVLAFYQQTEARRNTAITRRGIGLAYAALGATDVAIDHLSGALAIFAELDLWLDAAMALNGLGEAYRRRGEPSRALEAFTEALTASERCGSRFERARAHDQLGQIAAERGDHDQARRHWRRALAGYRALGALQADAVQQRLDASPARPPRST